MNTKAILKWVLLALILLAASIHFWDRRELLLETGKVSAASALLILCSKLIVALVNGLKLKQSTKFLGLRLNPTEWLGLSISTTFFSYTLPFRTSVAPRMFFLKKKHGIGYAENSSITISTNLLDAAFTAISGLVVLWLFLDLGKGTSNELAMGFSTVSIAVLLALTILFLAANFNIQSPWIWLNTIIERAGKAISSLKEQHLNRVVLVALIGLSLLARTAALYICFEATGISIDFPYLYVGICLVSLTIVVSLTPGNIGITESALLIVTTMAGIPVEQALPAILISRAGSLMIQLPLGAYYSIKLYGDVNPKITDKTV